MFPLALLLPLLEPLERAAEKEKQANSPGKRSIDKEDGHRRRKQHSQDLKLYMQQQRAQLAAERAADKKAEEIAANMGDAPRIQALSASRESLDSNRGSDIDAALTGVPPPPPSGDCDMPYDVPALEHVFAPLEKDPFIESLPRPRMSFPVEGQH